MYYEGTLMRPYLKMHMRDVLIGRWVGGVYRRKRMVTIVILSSGNDGGGGDGDGDNDCRQLALGWLRGIRYDSCRDRCLILVALCMCPYYYHHYYYYHYYYHHYYHHLPLSPPLYYYYYHYYYYY